MHCLLVHYLSAANDRSRVDSQPAADKYKLARTPSRRQRRMHVRGSDARQCSAVSANVPTSMQRAKDACRTYVRTSVRVAVSGLVGEMEVHKVHDEYINATHAHACTDARHKEPMPRKRQDQRSSLLTATRWRRMAVHHD